MQSNTLLRRPTTSSNPGTHSECQEDTTLSTTSTAVPFQFNPNANEFAMPRPALHSQSEFVQELFETWQRYLRHHGMERLDHAQLLPGMSIIAGHDRMDIIIAAYSSMRTTRCGKTLLEPYGGTRWTPMLRRISYLVYPLPPSGTNDIAAHVIMIQHEHPLWVTSLTSVMDDDLQHEEPEVQLAVTTHEHILFENVLIATDLVDRCMGSMGHPATHECHMWHQDTEIFRGRPYPGRIGIGIQVHIRRWQPPPQCSLV